MRTKLFTLAALLLMPVTAICVGAEPPCPARRMRRRSIRKVFFSSATASPCAISFPRCLLLAEEGFPGRSVKTEIVGYGGKNLFQHWECYRSYNRLNLSARSESNFESEIRELTSLGE
jgi:hypothetical protein